MGAENSQSISIANSNPYFSRGFSSVIQRNRRLPGCVPNARSGMSITSYLPEPVANVIYEAVEGAGENLACRQKWLAKLPGPLLTGAAIVVTGNLETDLEMCGDLPGPPHCMIGYEFGSLQVRYAC
jgi:hypothetical protein